MKRSKTQRRYSYAKNFFKRAEYRRRAYESYKKTYRKVADTYGQGMRQMYDFENFVEHEKEYYQLSNNKYIVKPESIVYRQIDVTSKEAKAGMNNFKKHLTDIAVKYNENPNSLSEPEANLVNKMLQLKKISLTEGDNPKIIMKTDPNNADNVVIDIKRLSVKDFRANNAAWQDIYKLLKNEGMQESIVGS